ncbi:MAG TPA: response regulator [Deltaproteobacteria bacterium]|nr:response regulator [Deltaproteobacteria bacterium]
MHIIVIDDDPYIGEFISECLENISGYVVERFPNPLVGLDYVLENDINCIFLDIHMPERDGLETLARLREKKPYVPVVMMTGNPSLRLSIEALRNGATDFLTKPFTQDQLLLCLEKIKRQTKVLDEQIILEAKLKAKEDIDRLNRELTARTELQSALFTISQELDDLKNESEIQAKIVELACRILKVKKAAFLFYNKDVDGMVVVASRGIYQGNYRGLVLPYQDSIVGRVLKTGCPYIASSLNGSPRLDPFFSTWGLNNPPLICYPVVLAQRNCGVLALGEKDNNGLFSGKELSLLEFLVQKGSLRLENVTLYENLTRNFYGTLQSLVTALEAKDVYTKWHSQRVTEYALMIAKVLGCTEEETQSIRTITFLHDIGKLGIQDSLLNKPGNLTENEYHTIQMHTRIGVKIVENLNLNEEEVAIIRNHHECWDGSGYPDGLGEEDIPFLARIVSVADSFDAMTSNRSYRKALNTEEAMVRLVEQRGRQFDPMVVDSFLTALKEKKLFSVPMISYKNSYEGFYPDIVDWGYIIKGGTKDTHLEVCRFNYRSPLA